MTGWLTDRRTKVDKLDSARVRQLDAMQELHVAIKAEFELKPQEPGVVVDREAEFLSALKEIRNLVGKYGRFAIDPAVLAIIAKIKYLISMHHPI